uniref:CSON004477 protein n=1 Tax=Culicoides sonorensis TaxID=179676 RepID=A0A336K7P1_CULSO
MNQYINCRACFTLINFSTDRGFKLSDEVRTLDITLAEIFTYCSELSLEKSTMDDGIVCIKCKRKLIEFYEFKKQIYETDEKFKELSVKGLSIKVEPELSIKTELVEEFHLEEVKPEILVQEENKAKDKPKKRYERKLRKKEDWELARNRREARKENLLKYQRNAEGLYECPDQRCAYFFKRIGKLEIHLEEQHSTNSYQCDICKKSFSGMRLISFVTLKAIREHMAGIHMGKRFKPVACKECGKCFPAESNLRNHKRNVHSSKQLTGSMFQCRLCGNFYKTRSSLTQHMEIHDKREMSCEFCNKIFYRERNLNTHLKIVHLNREKTLACHICGKAFAQKKSLDSHLFVHNDDRTFKCPKCPFSAKCQKTLSGHIKHIHSTEDPVNCEVCGQKVKSLYRLKKHMRLHTGPDLNCEFCDKTYKCRKSLQNHIDTIHRGKKKRHKCTICLKDLHAKRSLIEHIETDHKNEIEKTGKLANDFIEIFFINDSKTTSLIHTNS